MERGNQIVDALNRYLKDHGVYPEKLDALAPNYLTGIPLPAVGNQIWDYYAGQGKGDSFGLFVSDDSTYPNHVFAYHRDSHEWSFTPE